MDLNVATKSLNWEHRNGVCMLCLHANVTNVGGTHSGIVSQQTNYSKELTYWSFLENRFSIPIPNYKVTQNSQGFSKSALTAILIIYYWRDLNEGMKYQFVWQFLISTLGVPHLLSTLHELLKASLRGEGVEQR